MAIIDVLMPVYNCERYVAEALQSIQNQTVSDIKIIVIDDGSTDDTGDMIRSIKKLDERILYFRQENAGIVKALNVGLAMCDAPLIARMDGDDISYPDRFAKQLSYLNANSDCVGVAALVRHIDEHGRFHGHVTRVKDESKISNVSIPANEPSLIHPMLMVRNSAIQQVGGFRHVYNAEDTDLYWRLLDVGRLHALSDILGDYRIHPASLSSTSIESGRQQAVWSQLTALSDQRRRSKKLDIEFSSSLVQQLRRHRNLKDMVEEAGKFTSPEEFRWLTSAVAAKLIEMCYYRPYEPLPSDIKYILDAQKIDPAASSRQGYKIFQEGIISAGIRLLLSYRAKDAFQLVPARRWPILIGRVIFRGAFPVVLKDRVKKLIGRL